MIRLVVYLLASLVLVLGVTFLIALPGTVDIAVAGWRLTPSLGVAVLAVLIVIALSIALWAIIRRVIGAPSALARANARRKEQAGIEALSDGLIALQAGQYGKARALAHDAAARLPHNRAALLLEARAELALGDYPAAREHYRALIGDEKTALAALSGLYEQARIQDKPAAALTFARKALAISPELDWASEAVFADLAAKGAWAEALEMSGSLPARTRSEKAARKRREGILETALAMGFEETSPDLAFDHAGRALRAIPDFVPAALVKARIHINRGDSRRASSLLRRVWRAGFHPDIATLYAHVHPGTSAVERLKRVRGLVEDPKIDPAAALALARAAIDAYEWAAARAALQPFVEIAPTRAMCLLMAEIEEGQHGDQGKARAWLARAVGAPADPAWTADGVVSESWAPASPVTGRLDAFEWKVPVEARTPVVQIGSDPERGALAAPGAPDRGVLAGPADAAPAPRPEG